MTRGSLVHVPTTEKVFRARIDGYLAFRCDCDMSAMQRILLADSLSLNVVTQVTVQPKHLPTPEQWSEIFRNTPANGPQVVGTGTTGAERSLTKLSELGHSIIRPQP